MRAWGTGLGIVLLLMAGRVEAQDTDPGADEGSESDDSAGAGATEAGTEPEGLESDSAEARAPDAASDAEANPAVPSPPAPKVAVVLVGDPDDALRALARRVDDALAVEALRRPFDPGLRAALRGEPGEADDGFEEVRRERRRLGLAERTDAPVLARLGRRAGALAVAVVRAGDEGPELLMLDVGQAAFFEGALPLGTARAARIAEFVARRARASQRRPPPPRRVAEEGHEPDPVPDPAPDDDDEPDFFEQFWPYLVAGLLLAAMITAIAVTAATDESPQPVLRFVPGGR